jgi:hypothetical protein
MRSPHRALARGIRGAVVVLALVSPVLLIAQDSLAATSVTVGPSSPMHVQVFGPPAAVPGLTFNSVTLNRITIAVAGAAAAGRQGVPVVGAVGTTLTIPACKVGPCTHDFRGAGTVRLLAGDWAEMASFTLVQPSAKTGVASGFFIELAIQTAAGWSFTRAYFSSGTTPSRLAQTINLHVWIDLGVALKPTVLTADVVFDHCGTAGRCP